MFSQADFFHEHYEEAEGLVYAPACQHLAFLAVADQEHGREDQQREQQTTEAKQGEAQRGCQQAPGVIERLHHAGLICHCHSQ
jgi:hypothetical protein